MADLCSLSGVFCDPAGVPFGAAKLVIRPVSTQPTVREDGSIVAAVAVSMFETAEDGAVTVTLAPGLYRGSATQSAGGRSFSFDLAAPDLLAAPLADYIGVIDVAVQTSAQLARDQAVTAAANITALFADAGGVSAAVASAAAAADASAAHRAATAADVVTAEAAAANAQRVSRQFATWAGAGGLSSTPGALAGEAAGVLDDDAGTHPAASSTGYDGDPVPNAGTYAWHASWSRWQRIGDTGLAGKASLAALAAVDADRAALIDASGGYQSDRLAEFVDGAGSVIGHIDAGAAWHLLLGQLTRSDGLALDSIEYNGAAGIVVVDAAGCILWDLTALPDALTTAGGVSIESYDWSGGVGVVVVDSGGWILAVLDGDAAAIEAQIAAIDDEVTGARGAMTSLAERLAPGLSPSGRLRLPRLQRDCLRQLRQRQARLLRGDAIQIDHALIGDSFTHLATRWSGPFTDAMVARYGDGGGGWTGFGYQSNYSGPYVIGGTQPGLINGNARPSLYPVRYSGAWDRVTLGPGPDMHYVTAPAGSTLQREVPATPDHTGLRLVWIGTADGVVRWRVDGGGWTVLPVQGGLETIQSAILPLTAGAHVIEIEVVSGTVKLCGDNALSDARGYRCHKIARSGSRVSQWIAQDEVQQRTAWQALGITTWTVMEATNSQTTPGETAPAAWKTMMATLIARMRAASGAADICLFQPPDNQRVGNAWPMEAYADQARDLACETDCAFLDAQGAFGPDPQTYAWAGQFPLFDTDALHPAPSTGGAQLTSLAVEFHDFHPYGA